MLRLVIQSVWTQQYCSPGLQQLLKETRTFKDITNTSWLSVRAPFFLTEIMQKPDKASLWNMIMPPDWKIPSKEVTGKHAIDGGALLHRVSWKKGSKFSAIATQYSNYVKRRYGTSAMSSMGMKKTCCLQSQMRICQDRATKVHHVMWSALNPP